MKDGHCSRTSWNFVRPTYPKPRELMTTVVTVFLIMVDVIVILIKVDKCNMKPKPTCTVCGRTFADRMALHRHRKEVTECTLIKAQMSPKSKQDHRRR